MILLVNHESKARALLERALQQAGFNVSAVPVTGSQPREIALLISNATGKLGLPFAAELAAGETSIPVYPSDTCLESEPVASGLPEFAESVSFESLLIDVGKILGEIDPQEVS
jgi:hypothetical protein